MLILGLTLQMEMEKERKRRTMTLTGFAGFLGVSMQTLYNWGKNHYGDEELAEAMMIIGERIKTHQIEGGMAGIYNANLTARLTGMGDNMNVNADVRTSSDKPPQYQTVDLSVTPTLTHPEARHPEDMRVLFTQEQIDAGVQLPQRMKLISGGSSNG